MSIRVFVTPQLHGFFESSKVMRRKAAITAFGKKVPVLPGAFPTSRTSHLITFLFHHSFLFSERLALMNSQFAECRRRDGVYSILFNMLLLLYQTFATRLDPPPPTPCATKSRLSTEEDEEGKNHASFFQKIIKNI